MAMLCKPWFYWEIRVGKLTYGSRIKHGSEIAPLIDQTGHKVLACQGAERCLGACTGKNNKKSRTARHEKGFHRWKPLFIGAPDTKSVGTGRSAFYCHNLPLTSPFH